MILQHKYTVNLSLEHFAEYVFHSFFGCSDIIADAIYSGNSLLRRITGWFYKKPVHLKRWGIITLRL